MGRAQLSSAIYAVWLCGGYDQNLLSREAYTSAWNRRRLLQWFDKFGALPLVALLAYVGGLESFDQRDRIYSLIGLIPDIDRQLVVGTPDYRSDVSVVYSKLVKSFVQTHKSLDIICMAHIFNQHSRVPNTDHALPSWVPDWRVKGESQTVPLMVSQSSRSHIGNFRPLNSMTWNAVYEAAGMTDPRAHFSQDLSELVCEGVLLDVIDGLGGLKEDEGNCIDLGNLETPGHGHDYVPSASSVNQLAAWKQKDMRIGERRSAETILDFMVVVTRCLVLDRGDKYLGNRSPEHYRYNFEAFGRAARTQPDDVDPWFVDWFRRNKDLLICGQSLEELSSIGSAAPAPSSIREGSISGVATDRASTGEGFPDLMKYSDWNSFLSRFRDTTKKMRRRLIATNEGHAGMAPCRARKGDLVVVLFGCSVPVVLRQLHFREPPDHSYATLDRKAAYEIIGECYVDGFMNGEILNDLDRKSKSVQTFRLL